jgi:outer membrane protein OmpA-like peptidoglycan-associated protein
MNRSPFKITYIDARGDMNWNNAVLFSRDLQTPLNDGPVTFSKNGDTIYFSGNLEVPKQLSDVKNPKTKLGIFYSVQTEKGWREPVELRINSGWYNVTTPWISPDGQKLYFSSDKDGGFGGSDLYFCQRKNEYWDNPVNLGPEINTKGNEAFPYVTEGGDLFFSSDGHPGLGKKDIFFSRFEEGNWLKPVPLDSPVNSPADDFGFIADSIFGEGYFSSDRDQSVDIYHFKTNYPQIFYADQQKANQYCFSFSDSDPIIIDTNRLQYEWNFGDGGKETGRRAEHCFPGPGKYLVTLSVIEKKSLRRVLEKELYNLEIKELEQPFINSPDIAEVGDPIEFSALSTNIPGYKILDYIWDFGDKSRFSDVVANHVFTTPGEYTVKLGINSWNVSTSYFRQFSVSKKVMILTDTEDLQSDTKQLQNTKPVYSNFKMAGNVIVNTQYSDNEDIRRSKVFQVELMSSESKINSNNEIVRKISQKYRLREVYSEGIYSYIVAEELSFMDAYSVFTDLNLSGYRNVRIKTTFLTDQADIELYALKKVYGSSADAFFEKNTARISSGGFAFLDQIVSLMQKYPQIKLSVDVHSDDTGTNEYNLDLTSKRAESMAAYIRGRDIIGSRISARGYGKSVRLINNEKEESKKLNRRVQFQIIN